jgi:hypothetical protein
VEIQKKLKGRYNYDKKLRASKSLDIEITLPIDDEGNLNCEYMDSFIHIQQKETIRNVAKSRGREIELYRVVAES